MLDRSKVLAIVALLAATTACESGRYSAAGFRLPADGNLGRGKAAFQAHRCHSCHRIAGSDLPEPTVQPAVPVALGGEVAKRLSDGYLVTSIVYPSYRLAPGPREQITAGGRSRMPSYEDEMNVRELNDIVTFLQAQYTVRPPMSNYMYH